MIQVLLKAFSFVICLILGYGLKRSHLLREEDHRVISTIVTNVTLPCAIAVSFQNFQMDTSLFFFLLLPIVSNGLLIFLAWFTARREGGAATAWQIVNFPHYNIGSFTLPFAQSFMSPACVVAVCLFDTPNAFFTLGGSYTLACRFREDSPHFTFLGFFKRLMGSITLKAYTVLLLLTILDIHLPQAVFTLIGPAANANAFLSMLMLGMYLDLSFKKETLKKILRALICRAAVAVGLIFLIFRFVPLSLELKRTCALVLCAPFSAMNPLYTEKSGGDYKTSALANSISIMISILVVSTMLAIWNL